MSAINPYYLKTMFCCQNVLKFSDLVLFSYFMAAETGIREGEWLSQGHSETDISLGALPPPKRQDLHPLFLFCWFVGQSLLFPYQLLGSGSSSPRNTDPREERKIYSGSILRLEGKDMVSRLRRLLSPWASIDSLAKQEFCNSGPVDLTGWVMIK